MNKSLLLGLWKYLVRIPPLIWQGEVIHNVKDHRTRLGFMSDIE
jgi:hypothetical protein